MPEMPEVETIARKLRGSIIGKTVVGVGLSGLPLRRTIPDDLSEAVRGRTVRAVDRRGKYIIATLEPLGYLLIHLGMSGRVVYHATQSTPPAHTHVVFEFSDGATLEYRDHRRFGLVLFYDLPEMDRIPELSRLGRDPLAPGFRAAWLAAQLKSSRQEIKSFLLDQRRIAGLGNIYVCEALHCARLRPTRRCHTITAAETRELSRAIRRVLRTAILKRGTSFSDFMDSDGERGENQHFLKVFQMEGERCRRCRSLIRRLRQGNRSSFYCPGCQR